jgi:molybdenum cofactor cytidylyltransferase
MPDFGEIAVAVLAAGQGTRFGSDKLMADLWGQPMGLRVAEMFGEIPFGWRFAVCSKGAALVQHFSAAGFATIENAAPELGQSHSLHLAVRASQATGATSLLVVLADMPFVTKGHVERLLKAGEGIIASTSGDRPTPPALFPRDVWPMLLATSGDAGARLLLVDATLVHAPESELRDIDVAADLREMRRQ